MKAEMKAEIECVLTAHANYVGLVSLKQFGQT